MAYEGKTIQHVISKFNVAYVLYSLSVTLRLLCLNHQKKSENIYRTL